MSNEISLRVDVKAVVNGVLFDRFGPQRRTLDMSTGVRWADTVALTSDPTTFSVGAAVSTQMCRMMLQNRSTSVECLVGPSSDALWNRIQPNDLGYIGLVHNTTIVGATVTGTASLDVLIWSS